MNKQTRYRPIDMAIHRLLRVANRFPVPNATKAACIEWPASHRDLAIHPMTDRRPASILPSVFHLPKAQPDSAPRNATTTGERHSSAQPPDAPDPPIASTTPRLDFAEQHLPHRTDASLILVRG